jgi:hypothetical protein
MVEVDWILRTSSSTTSLGALRVATISSPNSCQKHVFGEADQRRNRTHLSPDRSGSISVNGNAVRAELQS